MKRHVKKLLASLLTGAMLVTSAMPVSAAETTATTVPWAVSNFDQVDLSKLSDEVKDFLTQYTTAESVESAFGAKVGKYSTEAVKNAIFEAIFVDRESNRVNFEALGLSAGDVEKLTAEVLAEMNAGDAVAYAVGSNGEGEATVMAVEIDPLYETAYDEIDTALGIKNEISTASDEERVIVISEDDVIETSDDEATMEDAYAAFNEYQQFIDDNPNYFGITVPYTSVKDDENEGGGPITSLVTIANEKVDYNGDGVVDENDNGITLLDLFKMGYVPASDLIQIIQMFHLGNQLAVNMLGSELLATKDEALKAVPADASDEQRLLALTDWIADKATFSMASIMGIEAPEPTTPAIYTQVVGALQQQGLGESDAQALAQQVMGLWAGTQFGILCESMGFTGVCMGYTYAYAYLVQWEFDEVYKDGGSWRTRQDLNYIENPEKVVEEVAVVAAADETPVVPAEGEDEDPECTEHVDENTDGLCDTCGATIEAEKPECTEHVDENADGKCDTCGAAVEAAEPECTEHVDENADGACDKCGETVETTPAHTHTYAETATWNWAEDNSSATATLTCTDAECDGSEGATLTATATPVKVEEESVAATCTATGKDVYTATAELNGTTFTDKKEVTTATAAHDFGEDGLAEECAVCGATNVDILPDYIWDPSADAMVDYVRITYDADVTLYGEEQDAFDSDHYWNAVKVNGKWYYVDPCYADIYIECMQRDRVETDGNMNHLYFLFSHSSTTQLYDGNYQSIDTLYADIATDTTYEDAWFAFAKSPVYVDGSKSYYFYDSTDVIGLIGEYGGSFSTQADYSQFGVEADYRLVYRDNTKDDYSDTTFNTLIDFTASDDEDTVLVQVRNSNGQLVDNEMLTELYAEHLAYQEKYPSIEISCDKEGDRLYFNISNCIMYYDVSTCEVVKVLEYNEVTAERDLTVGLGGMAFSVIDPEDAEEPEEGAEITTHTVKNNPIASMTIKDGKMYVSIGTTIAFISGRQSMEEDDSIGYQFEETNYNPDYNTYSEISGSTSSEENDNDEFMWSANFVDAFSVSDLTHTHTYEEVSVDATCGKNAFTENRCTECGAIEADTRVEVEGTAKDHHFIEFHEEYYTKDDNSGEFNQGTCYVCTECKDAKDELEDGDHVGHEYVGTATWNDVYTKATIDAVCGTCYGVNYDCLLEDATLSYEGLEATITKAKSEVDNEETGETEYYTTYTATATVNGTKCSDSLKVQYPFSDLEKSDYFYDAVLWAVDNGVTSGYTAGPNKGKFGPKDNCTRAQSVTFMWRAEGEPEVSEDTKNIFPDVEDDMFYTTPILWAVENGITNGYQAGPDKGKFGTNDTCTRGQIVTFLYRMAGEPEISEDVVNEFPDVKEGEYYYNAVLWAVDKGITNGYQAGPQEGNFGPNDKCVREHIVTFLYRYYNPEAVETN